MPPWKWNTTWERGNGLPGRVWLLSGQMHHWRELQGEKLPRWVQLRATPLQMHAVCYFVLPGPSSAKQLPAVDQETLGDSVGRGSLLGSQQLPLLGQFCSVLKEHGPQCCSRNLQTHFTVFTQWAMSSGLKYPQVHYGTGVHPQALQHLVRNTTAIWEHQTDKARKHGCPSIANTPIWS